MPAQQPEQTQANEAPCAEKAEKADGQAEAPKPAKKKLTLEIADVSETMVRLERKISP
jgi:hypothetical protein